MREGLRIGAALTAMALGASALAQIGFNCDLNSPFSSPETGGGVPSSSYAAAGVAGFWNDVTTGGLPTTALRNLNGDLTSVTITGPSGGGGGGNNIPGLTGDYRALMADATGVNPTKSYTLSGLANGTYMVFVYAAPITGNTRTTLVTVSGSISPNPVAVTGPMQQNIFIEGVTHSAHTSLVTDGELIIRADMAVNSTWLNGFQIVAVPEPASLILLASGSALLMRRRRKRTGGPDIFQTPPNGCPGQTRHDVCPGSFPTPHASQPSHRSTLNGTSSVPSYA